MTAHNNYANNLTAALSDARFSKDQRLRPAPVFMDVGSRETPDGRGSEALALAQSLPTGETPHCMTRVRSATQYRQFRSLIQTEAQTYRTLPLIPNTTSTFLVQQRHIQETPLTTKWRRSPLI